MPRPTKHCSYYINVGQVIGVVGGCYLFLRALKLEEFKAGMQRQPLREVFAQDVARARNWWSDTFGPTKQYTHR